MSNIDLDFLRQGNPEVFKEVITDNGYLLSQGCFKDHLVVDAGAHMGNFAYMANSLGQAEKIVCIEPNPKSYQRLHQCFGNHSDFVLYNRALSHNYEPVSISDGCCHSIVGQGSTTLAMPLEEITREYPSYSDRAILKMDIEGSEYNVLWSAHRRDVTFFKTIFIETHFSPARHQAMCEYLFQFGFKLTYQNQLYFWWTQPDGTNVGHKPIDVWMSRFDL